MAELQPAVLFRYENWIHAVSQSESLNEARIDVNVSFTGYKYWTLIFSQRASKGNGDRYQDGFVIGMSGGNNDAQNWIAQLEDLDYKLLRRNNFTSVDGSVAIQQWGSSNCYYTYRHKFEDLVTYKFVCDIQNKRMYCYLNQVYIGYGPLNFPTIQYPNGRLEVLKTWAQLGDSNCISYLGDVWLYGCQTLNDAKNYNGGEVDDRSMGKFLVHHSSHESGRKMVSDQYGRMYGWVRKVDPYIPPVPPDDPTWNPSFMRLRYTNGVTPTFSKGYATRVSASPNIWDLTYEDEDWSSILIGHSELLEVITANTSRVTNLNAMFQGCSKLTTICQLDTSNVTDMGYMFNGCRNLSSVPMMDTSKVTRMSDMFYYCYALTSVPLFDTSKVKYMDYMFTDCTGLTTVNLFNTSSATNMKCMFLGCVNVQSGALALYRQASSQRPVPSNHDRTFNSCGSNTQTGAAELAQIPGNWK